MKTLRLILGDQLNHHHPWFKEVDKNVVYCLFEMRQETDYVKHHIQKIAGFFAAMRNFASELELLGHEVIYFKINDKENTQSLVENLQLLINQNKIEKFEYQLPDEYRLDEQLQVFCKQLAITNNVADSAHFLSTRDDVKVLFDGKKQILMETFYRTMRKRYNILMDGEKPVGGKWNYDEDNRKKWKGTPASPKHNVLKIDVSEVVKDIEKSGAAYFGNINPKAFTWPISRKNALDVLTYFIQESLPYFGHFQDAMSTKENYLFHSRLSFALNVKLISPIEVVNEAVKAWQNNQAVITLPQIEGFVRQIIGWREYMRGIYWWKMPEYETMNFFNHQTKLPHYFWDADTKMNCIKHAVKNSLDNAYAHHIQRLMVTGNFALLAGINPTELDEWYLGIYIDALQWVEITNTRGMSQFADGGIVGSKPYVSSANYIDKMSDYCGSCHYNKSVKYGDKACPFNSLYWHFYERNQPLLGKNNRIGMMYNVLNRMQPDEREKLINQAEIYLKNIEKL
jgi:deoxyribodipyrimidine photolyase-related protein